METRSERVASRYPWEVFELPMRDGNKLIVVTPLEIDVVFELPMRDGNYISSPISLLARSFLNFL
mgnify:CR=1 FL=1